LKTKGEERRMKIKIELTFPSELKEMPIIWYISNEYGIVFNIIEASFSTSTGWAILVLESDEPNIKKAIDYLQQKQVIINKLEHIATNKSTFKN
jgi:ABC-type methionine transport system ATPase subunit